MLKSVRYLLYQGLMASVMVVADDVQHGVERERKEIKYL
jgi:hypothetical protein